MPRSLERAKDRSRARHCSIGHRWPNEIADPGEISALRMMYRQRCFAAPVDRKYRPGAVFRLRTLEIRYKLFLQSGSFAFTIRNIFYISRATLLTPSIVNNAIEQLRLNRVFDIAKSRRFAKLVKVFLQKFFVRRKKFTRCFVRPTDASRASLSRFRQTFHCRFDYNP